MPKQPDCMQHLSTAALLQKQYQACMLMQHTRKDTSSPQHLLLVLEGLFLSLSLSCESSVLLHRIEFSDVHKVSVMTSLCAGHMKQMIKSHKETGKYDLPEVIQTGSCRGGGQLRRGNLISRGSTVAAAVCLLVSLVMTNWGVGSE